MPTDDEALEIVSLRLQKAERQVQYMLEAVTFGIGCPRSERLRMCEKRQKRSEEYSCYECWKAVLEKL